MKKLALGIAILSFIFGSVTPAYAATAQIEVAKTADLSAQGEIVGVKIFNFPQRAGLYLMQCVQAAPNTRPTICNQAVQLWISNLPGASFRPTADITMKLDAVFPGADCTKDKCGVFVRYDHTASGDFTEDQFIALTFVSNKQSMKPVKSSLKIGKKLSLPRTTQEGAVLKYSVNKKSNKVCSLSKNQITALKAGNCNIKAQAAAIDGKSELETVVSLKIKR